MPPVLAATCAAIVLLLAAATSHADNPGATISDCKTAGPVLHWEFSVTPSVDYVIERWTFESGGWESTNQWSIEPYGFFQAGLEEMALYRVSGCENKKLDDNCARSGVVWSPVFSCPDQADNALQELRQVQLVEFEKDGQLQRFQVSKEGLVPLGDRIIQYNVYMLSKLISEGSDADLLPMAKPFPVGYDPSDMSLEDQIKLNAYLVYERSSGRVPDLAGTGLEVYAEQ